MGNVFFVVSSSVDIIWPTAEHAALRAGKVNGGWGSGKPEDLNCYAVPSCP